jgi:hypothetical protein
MQKLTNLVLFLILVAGCCIVPWVYQQELQERLMQREVNPLCKDTKTQTAWVAYKNGEARCFLEYDDFPHKAKGYSIE